MESERFFSLQLTIQKLEEELSLYRKGTSGQQLLELIAEKDAEIEISKKTILEKNDKLRQLARSSSDLLNKHQTLQKENDSQSETLKKLKHNNTSLECQLSESQNTITSSTLTISSLKGVNNQQLEEIQRLSEAISDRNTDIDKLQQRLGVNARILIAITDRLLITCFKLTIDAPSWLWKKLKKRNRMKSHLKKNQDLLKIIE